VSKNVPRRLAPAIAAILVSFFAVTALAADTIKVGILHSLSGTMAISETSLKDVALMTIEDINSKGGVLGKKLEPVTSLYSIKVLPNQGRKRAYASTSGISAFIAGPAAPKLPASFSSSSPLG
jgi:ABC-type branched-subunit amino acid transport system substrate-binding protein